MNRYDIAALSVFRGAVSFWLLVNDKDVGHLTLTEEEFREFLEDLSLPPAEQEMILTEIQEKQCPTTFP